MDTLHIQNSALFKASTASKSKCHNLLPCISANTCEEDRLLWERRRRRVKVEWLDLQPTFHSSPVSVAFSFKMCSVICLFTYLSGSLFPYLPTHSFTSLFQSTFFFIYIIFTRSVCAFVPQSLSS